MRIQEAIVVEGRYDKNTLAQLVDTVILETSGFGIFHDKAQLDLLRRVAEATGLPVNLFLSHEHGGVEQIGQRIIYNEIDMVLFFNAPQDNQMDESVMYITRLCDQHSVPVATNVATAELLIHGLARGDLDWREGMNPNRVPFAL